MTPDFHPGDRGSRPALAGCFYLQVYISPPKYIIIIIIIIIVVVVVDIAIVDDADAGRYL